VEMIRVLRVARRGALKARVAAAEQLHGVLYSAPEELRQPLLGLKTKALVGICAGMRPGPLTSPTAATKTTLRTLARRWQQLQSELDQLDAQLQALVAAAAPTLLALPGVGVDTAGQLLVTAGDNPSGSARRPPSRICAAPRPSPRPRAAPTATGSTGLVTAAPTTPCGASPWSGCTATHRPGPMSSGGPTKACPSSTFCAASSATSPARSTPTSQSHLPPPQPLARNRRHRAQWLLCWTERNATMLRPRRQAAMRTLRCKHPPLRVSPPEAASRTPHSSGGAWALPHRAGRRLGNRIGPGRQPSRALTAPGPSLG
jgi:hypothetical protein